MFSKLVIVVLFAVTVGLYLKIVVMEAGQTQVVSAPQASASIQVVEVEATATPVASASKALPEDQMLVIKQVFAPELLSD